MGNLFAITDPHALWNITGLQKLIYFIIMFYLCLPKKNKEKKLCQGAKNTSLDLLSTCLPVKSFVLTQCCVVTSVMKILIRTMSNVQLGQIFPRAACSLALVQIKAFQCH